MNDIITKCIDNYYTNYKNKKIGWAKYDSVFDCVRKELDIDIALVLMVYKDKSLVEVTYINSNVELNNILNQKRALKELIYEAESRYLNSIDNVSSSMPNDLFNKFSSLYIGKFSSCLHHGIFRSTGEFDAMIILVDSKNFDRKWTPDEKEVIKALGNLVEYDVLIKKMDYIQNEKNSAIDFEFKRKLDVISALTNEFSSIYLIDYDYGYMSIYQEAKRHLVSFLGKESEYSKAINQFFKRNNVVNAVKQTMALKLQTVRQKLERNDCYTVNLRVIKDNNVAIIIFNFSLAYDGNKKSIILSIREESEEITSELLRNNELEEMINYSRSHDPITGLYNRYEFMKVVSLRLKEDKHFYLIAFDVDRFSVYNNYYGVQKGDELLKHIASLLIELSDDYDIKYSKISNDNFLILLAGDKNSLDELVRTIKNRVLDYDYRFTINISVGVFEIDNKEIPIMYMIDNAMDAKKTIKYRLDKDYALFEDSMITSKEDEQDVINNMDKGIEDREFSIYLQPKVDITTGKVIGAEALVRWIKEDRIVPPFKFIPVFEKNGFIIKMDKYVWEETLKYLKWRKDNNLRLFPISVNVSRAFLVYPTFKDDVIGLTKKYGIEPKYLELELTETIFVSDINRIKKTFDELRGYGFKILMDDFGSGYSSLNVLKDVEFDILKIDMKFFSSDDERSQKIIETVIGLAKKLEIPAIAEGVETKKYVDLLKNYGCKYVQGYFYSKPLPVEEFNKYLELNDNGD